MFSNFLLIEPLEQFEIVKINYEWWYNNSVIESFILIIYNFFVINIYNFDNSFEWASLWWDLLDDLFMKYILSYYYYIFFDTVYISPISLIEAEIVMVYPAFIFDDYIQNYDLFVNYDFFDSYLVNNLFFVNSSDLMLWGLTFNSTIYYLFLLISSLILILLPTVSNLSIIPNNWQFVFENLYKFVAEMLEAQVGKVAQRFFPYIFVIFIFILTSNVLGMTIFSFTLTSHVMVTFTLGVSTFIGLTIIGFLIQKIHFLALFLPKGIPAVLLPMLVVIEVISYLSRALSLSIRLFANLMSGHTLLHILAFFSSKLFKFKFFIGILSFILILAIVALEFCIAILQAYVFAILICIYLNDSFHAH